jgi:hypothetical protein
MNHAKLAGALLAAGAAALAFLNTLPARFAFDDRFAVVRRPSHWSQSDVNVRQQPKKP